MSAYVQLFLAQHGMEMGREPDVKTAAKLAATLCYQNKAWRCSVPMRSDGLSWLPAPLLLQSFPLQREGLVLNVSFLPSTAAWCCRHPLATGKLP